MGRGKGAKIQGGGAEETQKKNRKSRSKKLDLDISLPAIQKIVIRYKPYGKRVGARTICHIAAQIKAILEPFMELACSHVKEGHMLNVKHMAQALNDPTSPIYGMLTHRVACVNPIKDTEPEQPDQE